jgi:hypothetical protein
MEHTYFKKVNMPEMPLDTKKILEDAIKEANFDVDTWSYTDAPGEFSQANHRTGAH